MLTHDHLILENYRQRIEDLRKEAENHRLVKSHRPNPRRWHLHKILFRMGGALAATGEALRARYAV